MYDIKDSKFKKVLMLKEKIINLLSDTNNILMNRLTLEKTLNKVLMDSFFTTHIPLFISYNLALIILIILRLTNILNGTYYSITISMLALFFIFNIVSDLIIKNKTFKKLEKIIKEFSKDVK